MIFEALYEADELGELILVDGGLCRWHLRKDGQLTIREILVLESKRQQGIGKRMLEMLKRMESATSIFAKCPSHLFSNRWYESCGFTFEGQEMTSKGDRVNLWRLSFVQGETESLQK